MSPLYYEGRELELIEDQTIFDYADSLKVRVPTSCRRSGECHECIVEIRRGMETLSSPTTSEAFLRDHYRLACQAKVVDMDATVEFAPLRREPKILKHSLHREVNVDPFTVRRGDDVCFRDGRIDRYRGSIYGLAIDLGTTTVVFNLVDLETGAVLHTASFENPQRFGGSDIMHRISYDGGEFNGELHQSIISSLNYEIREICRHNKIPRRQIYEAVIVGNAAMRDIFFGIDVQSIGQKPYKSTIEYELIRGERKTTALNLQARDLKLGIFPRANIYGGPLIGSHVGADVAADLLAIGIETVEETVMLVDVGTNTEVVVGNRHRLMAASCPAGPAFEGGLVTYGMPGYTGAIEAVKLDNDHVEWQTIGDSQPHGICGSGLIDLLAELRRTERMNPLGVFSDGSNEFCFVPERDMTLSRADLSALAQAKSANYCGQRIVLRNYGTRLDQIKKIYLAGGFANYINVENAIRIGFIPNIPLDRISKVGNTSLQGATIMLLSKSMRQMIEKLVVTIEHIELETTSDFFEMFVDGCMFNPMED